MHPGPPAIGDVWLRRPGLRLLPAMLLALAALIIGCGGKVATLPALVPGDRVVAFGDSLTFGTGAAAGESYPAQLADLIGHVVINAGVPGETTAAGLARLPGVLEEAQPRLLLLCLGGNDMLRGEEATRTAGNLRRMVRLALDRGVAVVLIGVPEPRLFAGVPAFYQRIAEEFRLPYDDEVFHEVLTTPGLKSDPIHANGAGYRRVAERLAGVLDRAGAI